MKFNSYNRNTVEMLNHEGAKAFRLTPEMELYSAVATTMLSDISYEKADERINRIKELTGKVTPGFVAKLAVYVREQMYLRSAPVVLVNELAKVHNGDDLVRKTVDRIVQRPDEITELLAYYQASNQRQGTKKLNRLSKQFQKGLADAFNKFDEYQFAKYDRATTVTLRDALFLVHPKAKDEAQQDLFAKIVSDDLDVPYTWETELSALGQRQFDSDQEKINAVKTKWEELIESNKMGYMATLRNLRNMIQANVSEAHFTKACTYLSTPSAVKHSKQLPFRFLAAYRELENSVYALEELKATNRPNKPHVEMISAFPTASVLGKLEEPEEIQPSMSIEAYVSMANAAIEKALVLSVENLRGFDEQTRVVIACDVSGSMQTPVSARSAIKLYDIGLLLGMLLHSKCQSVVSGMFGDSWKIVPLSATNILANVAAFYRREGEVGYSTNGYKVVDDLIKRRHVTDKVMLFTDVQLWDSDTQNTSNANTLSAKWRLYKRIAPEAKLYLFDLAGYGSTPLQTISNDVFLIAGWSDKVFDLLQALEEGQSALEKIKNIAL